MIFRSFVRCGASLRAPFWFNKDHEDFQRLATNKSFPRTQELIQSVQRQLIERKDEYQYAGIAGLINVSLVKNHVAE